MLLVLLLAADDLITALGSVDVGKRHVDVLADDAAVDLLVHANSDSALGDVEHNTGAAVVVLEGHALVHGGVNLDINIVSSLYNGRMALDGTGLSKRTSTQNN